MKQAELCADECELNEKLGYLQTVFLNVDVTNKKKRLNEREEIQKTNSTQPN